MITIQHTQLHQCILSGIAKAKEKNESVLVSEIVKIEYIDPLAVYTNGQSLYTGERFFWKDPDNQSVLVGIGVMESISAIHEDRFQSVEKRWKRFTQDAIIINGNKMAGTGPLLFGGFSFDPLKEKSGLWDHFGDTIFHVPKYMVSIIKGEAYFTTNVLCTQFDDYSLSEKIEEERSWLLNSVNQTNYPTPKIVEKREVSPDEWKNSVAKIVSELKEGALKKVVLARELRLHFDEPLQSDCVLRRLNQEQPESFIFAFESSGECFIGASPERLVKKQGNEILSTCLAGSIKRGKTTEEDEHYGNVLLSDEKNLVEHQIVVNMINDALEKVCTNIEKPEAPSLLKMRDIQHLYTPVKGKCTECVSLIEVVGQLHPTPALGGWPKLESVERIREIELLDRGLYGAPIGWIDIDGNGEFAVAIRSGLIQGNEASLFAGCGVVADSDPESEYIETNIKFRPMLSALGGEV